MITDFALYPKLVATAHSDINGDLEIFRVGNSYRLDVGGLTQSGSVMTHVWRWGIDNLFDGSFKPSSILMLGVAGGSALKWLSRKFPQASLVGVDVDPVMVELGRKYFGLSKIPNLEIFISDAGKFLRHNKRHFSLILMDCYKGFQTPADFEDLEFLKQIKSQTDHFLINRLYWGEHIIDTTSYVLKLQKSFEVRTVATESNLIISLNDQK